ncbi:MULTISPECIES: hypothetical protein [Sphingobacterium]|nr:hypothetical protein [Sphingobacterium sp. E70]ULT23498.1 hypothetical protein KUH03_30645 [Sphingobacterium sp. E70]
MSSTIEHPDLTPTSTNLGFEVKLTDWDNLKLEVLNKAVKVVWDTSRI